MEPIANIISKEMVDAPYFINVTGDTANLVHGIPTLVVGWETTKELFPEANILKKQLDHDTWWTFGRREKGDVYEKDKEVFLHDVVGRVIDRTEYKFVNVFTRGSDVMKEFTETLKKAPLVTVVQYKDMVYCYPDGTSTVYGISLRDCDYAGYNRKAMAMRINELCGNRRRSGMRVGCPYHEIVRDFNGKAYMLPRVISASLGGE